MVRIGRHSASADVELAAGGLLMVTMRGPLTPEVLRYFHNEIIGLHCTDVRGFVADFRPAAIAVDGLLLDALFANGADSPAALPAALVVTADCIAMFRGHALRIAGRHGITRCVFTDLAHAVSWARLAAARQPA